MSHSDFLLNSLTAVALMDWDVKSEVEQRSRDLSAVEALVLQLHSRNLLWGRSLWFEGDKVK